MGANALMAYKQSKYPDEAKTFLKWWSENSLDLWAVGHCGALPARKSITSASYFSEDAMKKGFTELILPFSVPENYPVANGFPEMSNIDGEQTPRNAYQLALTTNRTQSRYWRK
jgi:multiple sugar transport system substrate-binding protein